MTMISVLAVLTLRLVDMMQISNRARMLPSAHCRRSTFPISPGRIGT